MKPCMKSSSNVIHFKNKWFGKLTKKYGTPREQLNTYYNKFIEYNYTMTEFVDFLELEQDLRKHGL